MGASRARGAVPALTLVESANRSATFARWSGSNVLFCTGDLGPDTLPDLHGVLETVADQAPDGLVVDLAAVTSIDDDAVRTFVEARTSLHERGADLVVRSPSSPISRIVARAGLAELVRPPDPPIEPRGIPSRIWTGWDDAAIVASWRKLCATQAFGASELSFLEPTRLVTAVGQLLGGPATSPRTMKAGDVRAAARLVSSTVAVAAVQLVALNRAGHRWIDDHAVASATHRRWSATLDGATTVALTTVLDRAEGQDDAE